MLLSARKLCRSFGENQVLFDVDLDLQAGEVHALLGENGAGKSTLVKILAGYLRPTSGEVLLDGKQQRYRSSGEAEADGVVMIHQELALAEQLSAEENIFLGRELRRGPFLDRRAMREQSRAALEELETHVDPRARVKDLSTSDQQMVEIAKAITRDVRVLIMDEPTATLTEKEVKVLFELIARLRQRGVAILYISHKLREIEKIADRVTVLRDGHLVDSGPMAGRSKEELARLMVGREIHEMYPPRMHLAADAPVVLEARDMVVPGAVKQASFTLRRGEVLGFGGVVGAGRTALIEAVLGLRGKSAGQVLRNGQPVLLKNLRDAVHQRIAYLTEDRKGKGLVLNMDLRSNVTLLNLRAHCHPLIDRRREEQAYQQAIQRFDIRLRTAARTAAELSGGNQQKLLLAKVMSIDPEVVIINEPTRGIDVGTKHQIYHFIHELTETGCSVILISSEMGELIGLSHRVAVMCAGVLTGMLEGEQINEHEIMQYASGIKGVGVDEQRYG
ncbi:MULTISPECIES: sugar ABC transporter ATP-binding protein [unclassified Halomonas]|uniref:sugar ABC transporter ATP-binding protein n=1 Tax=unclassified Halomonas TaxID=2609666 RepID=UPI0007DA1DF1|nr:MULTISPECIES: sugar ABC transporter ATP-binding protein [unclassified Halomonas]MBT2786046.1 sugar ABC transporter ATP-binding protein [Halomonas sp. ISL-106]MBT2797068.1 sugar ABC transporter ATP-binding protein [Halomonas sp. ISL-104]OAL58452.1 ABC transporter ATP-binding protein [Halomonas sp. ALS9]